MKKAYLYFLLPLVGLALFGAVYWQFASNYEKKQADIEAATLKKKQDQVDQLNRDREKALTEAKIAQDKRKAEKAAREAREAKEKEDRMTLDQGNRKAQSDAERLEEQAKRLAGEIEEAKKENEKIAKEQVRLVDQEKFLKDYVKQVTANKAALQAVVEKIDAADKAAETARREAAAAAAAAAKKK